MAIRRRTILWIIAGIVLLPCVLLGTVVAYLMLWPGEHPPSSQVAGAPSQVTATAGRGQVTVRWSDVPEAVSYQVFKSDRQDRDFRVSSTPFAGGPVLVERLFDHIFPGQPFGRLPHPLYVDTAVWPGHTYYYRVRANDGSAWGEFSTTAAATVPAEGKDARVTIRVDASRDVGTLEHKWEMVLGSEHLSYMLKGDLSANLRAAGEGLRKGNKLAHDELGIRYIRAHGILMDDLGVYREDAGGKPVYDWSGVDKVYDTLRADGLKPFVELSFMPSTLASNPQASKLFFYKANISPPKDYAKWSALVAELARHLIARYGQEEVESWPFEVWNEPDLRAFWPVSFWGGSDDDYFRLYDFAALALKSVDPKLRVGGPVAAFTQFEEPFLKHLTSRNYAAGGANSPIDFLDVHTYSGSPADWRPLLARYGLKDLPVYYTEWGVSAQWNAEVNDLPYGAAWIARGLNESIDHVATIAYWTASDYFEELGPPQKLFHGGFGLIGLEGIRKPRYWAYYLLHQLGTRRVALEGEGDGFAGLVNGWATRGQDAGLKILLWNVTFDQSQAAGAARLARQVGLRVSGLPAGKNLRLRHYRVDNAHSNVYAAWQAMGKPDWPNAAQMSELHRGDELQTLEPPRELAADSGGRLQIEFDLPMPSLSLIELAPAPRLRPAGPRS